MNKTQKQIEFHDRTKKMGFHQWICDADYDALERYYVENHPIGADEGLIVVAVINFLGKCSTEKINEILKGA